MGESETSKIEALPKLGFLGLGQMGGPMTRTLLRAGYPVMAYDPVAESLEGCAAAGAEAAKNAADAVRGGEIVLTSLRSSATFVQVAEEDLLPNARPGQLFMDMGTGEPGQTRRLAREFARKGAALIDAPARGGPSGTGQAGTTAAICASLRT